MFTILQSTLRQHGLTLTRPRREVFASLVAHAPCSSAALATHCKRIDRATVYRTVALFEKHGIVIRIWHGFKSQLELGEIFIPHHHHLTCSTCQQTIELHTKLLEDTLEQTARQHGFALLAHSVELTGECASCRLRHAQERRTQTMPTTTPPRP